MNKKEVDKKSLESGKVLIYLKERFLNKPTQEHILQLFDCLTDSDVWVPMNMNISEESKQKFINTKVGEVVSLDEDLRLKPDYLADGEDLYLPIFSNVEQAEEEYRSYFNWINLDISQCFDLISNTTKCKGIILDFRNNSLIIKDELLKVLKDINTYKQEKSN